MAFRRSFLTLFCVAAIAVVAISLPISGHAQNRPRPIDGCEVMPGLSAEDVAEGQDLIPPVLRSSIIGGKTACRWEKQIANGKHTVYRAYYETRFFGVVPAVVTTAAPFGVVTTSTYIGPDAIVDFDRTKAMVKSPAAMCYLAKDTADPNKLICSQSWDKYIDMVVEVPASGSPRQYFSTSDQFKIKAVQIRSGGASVDLFANYDPTIIQVSKGFESAGNDARPVILAALQSGNAEVVRTSEDGTVTVEVLDMTTPKLSFNILNQVAKVMSVASRQ